MKTIILVGLCVTLGASFVSVRAGDTPVQAAARAALLQKLNELDHPQIPPQREIAPAATTPVAAPTHITSATAAKGSDGKGVSLGIVTGRRINLSAVSVLLAAFASLVVLIVAIIWYRHHKRKNLCAFENW